MTLNLLTNYQPVFAKYYVAKINILIVTRRQFFKLQFEFWAAEYFVQPHLPCIIKNPRIMEDIVLDKPPPQNPFRAFFPEEKKIRHQNWNSWIPKLKFLNSWKPKFLSWNFSNHEYLRVDFHCMATIVSTKCILWMALLKACLIEPWKQHVLFACWKFPHHMTACCDSGFQCVWSIFPKWSGVCQI